MLQAGIEESGRESMNNDESCRIQELRSRVEDYD